MWLVACVFVVIVLDDSEGLLPIVKERFEMSSQNLESVSIIGTASLKLYGKV